MDLWILAIGVGTFGLLMGGLAVTVVEFRRMKPGDTDGTRP
jgi:hypothetical protein